MVKTPTNNGEDNMYLQLNVATMEYSIYLIKPVEKKTILLLKFSKECSRLAVFILICLLLLLVHHLE